MKMWTWLRKRNLKRETESRLVAAQNNAIRTKHIKARIDKPQQNSKCRLFGNRDEIINHIISECSKLVQKEYKTRHDWVGKVIHWELCKTFKFDHTNKWYVHKPESVLEYETHKHLCFWDTNKSPNFGQTTRPYNNQRKKRNCRIVDFAVPTDSREKLKENEKKDKYLELTRELEKTVEHENNYHTNCNWCTWYSHQRICQRTRGLGNIRTSGDHPNYSIVEISQNIGDLKRLVFTQTSVKDRRLTLMWKTTNKWYMHNPESVQENETHKLLWYFNIQTDHQISARRPDLMIINRELAELWTLLSLQTTEWNSKKC